MQVQEIRRRLKNSQTKTLNQGRNIRENGDIKLIVENSLFQSVAIKLRAHQRRV
jgi:hypothetical protein